jgi:hypothetical protein
MQAPLPGALYTQDPPSLADASEISKSILSKTWRRISKGTIRRPKILALTLSDEKYDKVYAWLHAIGCRFESKREWGKDVTSQESAAIVVHSSKRHYIFVRTSETENSSWYRYIIDHELKHVYAHEALKRLNEVQRECVTLYAEALDITTDTGLEFIFGSLRGAVERRDQ